MKLVFEEVAQEFDRYRIWHGGREICWYKKAWMVLAEKGLTTYKNPFEKNIIIIRSYTLMMIYMEFCELAFKESFEYEFPDWKENEELSQFRIGQMTKTFWNDEEHLLYEDYSDDDALDVAFMELVEEQRITVIDGLIDNVKYFPDDLFVWMYLTCHNMRDFEVTSENSIFEAESANEFKLYENDIEEYYRPIIDKMGSEEEQAYHWLIAGTYRIKS
jgi:hypothetical protein